MKWKAARVNGNYESLYNFISILINDLKFFIGHFKIYFVLIKYPKTLYLLVYNFCYFLAVYQKKKAIPNLKPIFLILGTGSGIWAASAIHDLATSTPAVVDSTSAIPNRLCL